MELQAYHLWFCFVLLLFTCDRVATKQLEPCSYKIHVGTGNLDNAGTNADVTITLCPAHGKCVVNKVYYIPRNGIIDLDAVASNFEKGNVDNFVLYPSLVECVDPCRMIIRHNNFGKSPDWYLDFVRVETYWNKRVNDAHEFFATYEDVEISNRTFTVNRWLAIDRKPYKLVEEQDQCRDKSPATGKSTSGAN